MQVSWTKGTEKLNEALTTSRMLTRGPPSFAILCFRELALVKGPCWGSIFGHEALTEEEAGN